MGTYFTKVFRKKTICRDVFSLAYYNHFGSTTKKSAINSPQVTKELKLAFSNKSQQVLTPAAGTLLGDGYIMSLKRI